MLDLEKVTLRWAAFAVVLTALTAMADPPPAGVAPVVSPAGGFGIEGDLIANSPIPGVGDWVVSGSGTGVLNSSGAPLDSTRTFHFIDPYDDTINDRIFSGGNKWLDNPNTWGWTGGKPSGKTDINNVLMHLTTDTNGHVWAILAADRYSTAGDSYIDFELLQNPLIRTTTNTFVSTGPNSGRTTNDLLLSLAFTGGGKVADFLAWRWAPAGAGTFTYTNFTSALPAGGVFVALNSNNIVTPYAAFGGNTYAPNAFAEAAIDLTALLGNFNQCESFGFKTIMIKTKASSSSSASIEDFIDPIAYTLNIGPAANAGPDQTRCSEGTENVFALNGSASIGVHPIASTVWTVVSGSATIDSPSSLVTTARVTSTTATLRLTVTQVTGCAKSDDIVLTAQSAPTVSINGPTSSCPRATNIHTAPVGMASYLWNVSGNGSISGPANQSTVKVIAGGNCGQSYTLSLMASTNVCTVSPSSEVLVTDNAMPVLTVPADRVLDCPADTSTNANGVATATDSCSRVTVTYNDSVTNGCGFTKVIARTWTATDECGNSDNRVQLITVRDITRPTLAIPANRTLQFPADTTTAANGVATSSDGCGSATVTFNDVVTPGCGNTITIARIWTATDLCGNSTNRTQTITVNDTTPPAITCPPSLTLECPADTSTNSTGIATATDAGGNVVIRFVDSVTNGCGNNQIISRRWTATDDCGNNSSCTQLITVRDTTPPVITCPTNVTLEFPADVSPAAVGAATATDSCTTANIAYSDSVNSTCAGSRVITRTWSAWDSCSNTSRCVQTITVRDTTAPVVSIPVNITVECGQSTATNITGVATATDAAGIASITYVDTVTPNCGNTVTIARRWTATDLCNNSSSGTQIITVRDTTPPVIARPANLTLECTADTSTAATGIATATDTCGSVTVTYSDSVSNACGNARVISRTWRAIDSCDNVSTSVQTLTLRDTTPPVITCPPSVTLECPADTRTNATGVATAFDTCGNVAISYADSVTNGCGNNQTISRRWTATDDCGNSSSCTQVITVRDTTPPVVNCPTNITLEYPGNINPTNTGFATATDNCTAASVAYTDSVTNVCGGSRIIARTWAAWDSCNNTSRCVQVITVRDTTPPVVSRPPNITVECGQSTATNATGMATATDLNSVASITFADSITNTCGNTVIITRRWTATDVCNNSASATQTITVRDTTPPAITRPADVVLECPADTSPVVNGTATATDTCGSVVVTYSDSSSNTCGNARVILRTWRATDSCGNVSTAIQTLTGRDTTAPVLAAPANVIVECGASTAPAATGMATATDTCNTAAVTYLDTITNLCGSTKVITRTWSATDTCGNKASAVQTITVRDTIPPTLGIPANVVQQCPGDTRTNVTGVATAQDGCGTAAIGYSDVVTNGCGATRTVFRTWTAVDQCGNSTNRVQIISVIDTTKPVIACPNISVQCGSAVPAPYADVAAFLSAGGTVSDNCDSSLTFSMVSNSVMVGTCPATMTRVYRVTDDCGNFADVSQKITVADTIPPVLTCVTGMTVTCNYSLDPTNTGFATATDNCDTNVTVTYSDAPVASSYNVVDFFASDPEPNSGPYSPTYAKLSPASMSCPPNGRAQDPLRNAVCYASDGSIDALTTMSSQTLYLGQITPFQVVVTMDGAPGPEKGRIEFTADWATHTTSNDRFGFDTNYMVYCAFVDPGDRGTIDPHTNARVESVSSVLVNSGTIDEKIRGTIRLAGLDPGDRVVVEVWLVLNSTYSSKPNGTISAGLVSGYKVLNPPVPINVTGSTISINANKVDPLPAPQTQPPLPPLPSQPPVEPGIITSVIDRTWAATDDCGNRSACVQRFTVMDSTPPSIAAPANVVLEYPSATGTNITGVAVAQDCGSVAITYSDTVSNSCGFSTVVSRLWTATDEWGNATNAVQIISVRDTTAPVIVAPTNAVVDYPASTNPSDTGTATATDASGAVTIGYSDTEVTGCGPTKVITRTWTATDACGNTSSKVQMITVRDITAPVIVAPVNAIVDYPASTNPSNTGTATATDAGSAVTIGYSDTEVTGCGPTKIITRTWTAADACGNTFSKVQMITVRDNTAPVLVVPANAIVDYPASTSPSSTGTATATDTGSSVTIGYNDTEVTGCGPTKVITRTWSATDACGNTSSKAQTITVRDITAPVILAPVNAIVDYPASTNPSNTGTATATDAGGSVAIGYSDTEVTGCGPTKVITRTWTATDSCGNTSSKTQTITVRDITAPVLVVPANAIVDYPASTSPSNTGTATATDVGSSVTIGYSDTEVTGCGPTKVITRAWTATDACGNTSSKVQTITARDITAPAIVAPRNAIVDYPASTSPSNTGAATATDDSGSVTIDHSDTEVAGCGPTKVITRTWTATDTCGNTSSKVQTITVRDITAPALVAPANSIVDYPASTSPSNTGTATATDAGSSVTIGFSDTEVAGCGPTKVITRTWTATDACGNSSSTVQTITVRDITAPTIVRPMNVILDCPADTSPSNTGTATGTDASGTVTISYSDISSNSCGATAVIARTWTATDACGNKSSSIQTITIRDTTPPTISELINRTITAGEPFGFNMPTASDTCSTATLSVVSTTTNSISSGYIVTRVWKATDACGNRSTNQTTLTVNQPVSGRLTISMVPIGGNQLAALIPRSQILLAWPTNVLDYRLEFSTTSSAKRWYPVAVTPVATNSENRVYVTPTGPSMFFRLVNTPPYLESVKNSGNTLRLTWPTAPSGFQLETSDTMAPGSWTSVGIAPSVSNALNNVVVPANTGKKFFRLKK